MCDDTYTETSVINKESHEYTVSGRVIKEPTHIDEGEMELWNTQHLEKQVLRFPEWDLVEFRFRRSMRKEPEN